jgi:hypothetical protein
MPSGWPGLLVAFAGGFYQDVMPILEKRCLRCHQEGGIAPMAFETYEQARPWAKAIRESTVRRKMPPWFVEQASVRFHNDPSLSDADIASIDRWVRDGAPAGPASPAKSSTPIPHLAPVDLVIRMPEAVGVPARGEPPYQFMILPRQFPEERWVSGVEVRPGAARVVHHAVVYVRERESSWLRGRPPGKAFSGGGVTQSDILAVYAPGQAPAVFPKGMAKKIPAGADLVLQMHYTPSGSAVADRTEVAIQFHSRPVERRVLTLQIATTDFLIPAGEADHRVTAFGTLPNDSLLIGLFPHMHLRGKAFEYALVEPEGRVETLLRVKPYDFHWQLDYRLAEPRLLRKGSRLRCTAWYDNSAKNPRNPDPSADVRFGEPSTAEMMVGFFDVAVPAWMDKDAFFKR